MKLVLSMMLSLFSIASFAQSANTTVPEPVNTKIIVEEKVVGKDEIVLSKLQKELYDKCFDHLLPTAPFANFPNLPDKEMCSIKGCFLYLHYDNQVKAEMQKRLKQVVQRFYYDGYFIQLISGEGSVQYCNKQNKKKSTKCKIVFIPIPHKEFWDFSETKYLFNDYMKALWKDK